MTQIEVCSFGHGPFDQFIDTNAATVVITIPYGLKKFLHKIMGNMIIGSFLLTEILPDTYTCSFKKNLSHT